MSCRTAQQAHIFPKDTRPAAPLKSTPTGTPPPPLAPQHVHDVTPSTKPSRNQHHASPIDQLGNLQPRRTSPSSGVLTPTLPSLVMAAAKSRKKAPWSAA